MLLEKEYLALPLVTILHENDEEVNSSNDMYVPSHFLFTFSIKKIYILMNSMNSRFIAWQLIPQKFEAYNENTDQQCIGISCNLPCEQWSFLTTTPRTVQFAYVYMYSYAIKEDLKCWNG